MIPVRGIKEKHYEIFNLTTFKIHLVLIHAVDANALSITSMKLSRFPSLLLKCEVLKSQ